MLVVSTPVTIPTPAVVVFAYGIYKSTAFPCLFLLILRPFLYSLSI
jgi:hypothetical protein